MRGETDLWTMSVILGMAVVTVLTRCFFFILDRPWSLPDWAHRALQYAPVAALAGVVVPEVIMANGHLVSTWPDARIFSAAAGPLLYFWRRSVLLTRVLGMAVYLHQVTVAPLSQMQVVAINWHIYLLTATGRPALALGAVGLTRVIPIILFSLAGGVAAVGVQ